MERSNLTRELGSSSLRLRRRILRSHIASNQKGIAELFWISRHVFGIANDLLNVRQSLLICCIISETNGLKKFTFSSLPCVNRLMKTSPPALTASTTIVHMEYTTQAVEEESTPPLSGKKNPPWHERLGRNNQSITNSLRICFFPELGNFHVAYKRCSYLK